MTEERQKSSNISMLHSMLSRLKSPERPQGSSHVTAQGCRHSDNTDQSDSKFSPRSYKVQGNFAGSNPSECSVKPKEQNDTDEESKYFTRGTVFQDSSRTSNTFLQNEQPSHLLHNLVRDARQDLQPSKSNHLWEDVKEEQTRQVESHFSILKNSPPHEPYANGPKRSSLSNSEPKFVQETTVPMEPEYEIMVQPCRSENIVTSLEEEEPPALPPKLRNLNKVHVPLQRTCTLKDFKLDLEPINLLEEICTGEEWAKFLPAKNSSPETDAIHYSQTEDSHHSKDDIGSQNAVIKPDLSADKEQSDIGFSPASITDSQVDRGIQVRQETSDSPIYPLPKTPIRTVTVTQRKSDVPEYEVKNDENDFVVIHMYDKNDVTKVKDTPLDLSVIKSSGVLDNSALKSRIQLSKKRKHRPPEKRKKGNTKMAFFRQHSAPTKSSDSPTSPPASVIASSKFYAVPCLEYNDSQTHEASQTAGLNNEKALARNAAVLQRASQLPESYSNNNDISEFSVLSNKAKMIDASLDFSYVKSSGVLDNSALKNRIQLSKKRKHRPPGKRKKENGKLKFSTINFFRHGNASNQPRPFSYPSAFTSSAFITLPRSHNNSQTPVSGNDKQKEKAKKTKLWKKKT